MNSLSRQALNTSLHGILDPTETYKPQMTVFHVYCPCNHKIPMVFSFDTLHHLTVACILKTISSSSSAAQQPTSGSGLFNSLPLNIPIWKLYVRNILHFLTRNHSTETLCTNLFSPTYSEIQNLNDYATESK